MSEELDRYDLVGRQRRELAGKMRRELADHDARESAGQLRPRPAWRVELDDLLIANYANDAFWFGEGTDSGLISVMLGSVSDDMRRRTSGGLAGDQLPRCPPVVPRARCRPGWPESARPGRGAWREEAIHERPDRA